MSPNRAGLVYRRLLPVFYVIFFPSLSVSIFVTLMRAGYRKRKNYDIGVLVDHHGRPRRAHGYRMTPYDVRAPLRGVQK